MDLRSRWPLGEELYRELVACYREPHRHYHTLQHLEECFEKLDEIRTLAPHPRDVELALWFHDAIYDTRRSDNETRSAEWARTTVGASVAELVMATRHDAIPADRDAQVLVDVDLSILGASRERFDEYEEQVRSEYGWVPALVYRRKRREILESFIARASIYATPLFIERYEAQARDNLARAIARL